MNGWEIIASVAIVWCAAVVVFWSLLKAAGDADDRMIEQLREEWFGKGKGTRPRP